MEIDRKQLEKILSMDNESFSSLARSIASAAGANKLKTEVMLANPDMLKRRIASITSEEAQQLIDAAGKEKSEEIIKMLKDRGVDIGRRFLRKAKGSAFRPRCDGKNNRDRLGLGKGRIVGYAEGALRHKCARVG